MGIKIILVLTIIIILILVNVLCYRRGKDAQRIKQLKDEIRNRAKEQEYANEKVDIIRNLSDNDVRNRLHRIANEKHRNM
jgi:septation ring formation regulator EzrA